MALDSTHLQSALPIVFHFSKVVLYPIIFQYSNLATTVRTVIEMPTSRQFSNFKRGTSFILTTSICLIL